MNSTQDTASRRPITIHRHRVQASEEIDDSHYSFLKETEEQSETQVSATDMCALGEWPSHARRNRELQQNETGGQKKKGRGVLKGIKASKKRYANGSEKLTTSFSDSLGGTIGINYSTFCDDVVLMMKRRLPLIGVRTWADIHPTIHRQIVVDMLDRYDLDDIVATEETVLKVAHERYRGWRSTVSVTYKAYKIDAARLANVPEDVQPEESQDVYDKASKEIQNKEAEMHGPISSEERSNIFQTTHTKPL